MKINGPVPCAPVFLCTAAGHVTAMLMQENAKIFPIAKNLPGWEHFGSFIEIFVRILSLYHFFVRTGSSLEEKCSQSLVFFAIGTRIVEKRRKMG